jgi:adenylate cyclase
MQTDPVPALGSGVAGDEERLAVLTVEAAVLFADLRGYTALAERLRPADVLARLHQFFAVLISVVENHGGQVFHVAGDNLMAGFGLRQKGQNGGWAALASGRAMLAGFSTLGERWHRELGLTTGLGVGVHFGEVAVGLLGPTQYKSWTLIGDTVNVAARLCDRARAGEVLFSAAVLANIHSSPHEPAYLARWDGTCAIRVLPLCYRQLSSLALRGRREPLEIWCLPTTERTQM